MSAKEKKWKKFYKVLFILFYGFGFPFSLILYFTAKDTFPYALLTVVVFLPTIRYNHLKQLRIMLKVCKEIRLENFERTKEVFRFIQTSKYSIVLKPSLKLF